MKILVTGGAGFIGSNFCNLNKAQHEITALDNFFLGTKENLHPDVRLIEGDACREEDLQRCGDQFDVVIHFAGTSSAPMFMGDGFVHGYVNAVESFVRTLEFARKAGAKKFLYASTSSIYGNNPVPLVETQQVTPLNHYAATKFLYEHCAAGYAKVYPEMETIGFRFMSVYGPNEEAKGRYANMITQFVWDVVRGRSPIIYGSGEQTRDFTNVLDVVQAITLAIETDRPIGNRIYNIGRGEGTSFNDILKTINEVLEKDIASVYIENPVKEGYVRSQHADITRIQEELGFAPKIGLQEGIEHLVSKLDPQKIKESSSDLLR